MVIKNWTNMLGHDFYNGVLDNFCICADRTSNILQFGILKERRISTDNPNGGLVKLEDCVIPYDMCFDAGSLVDLVKKDGTVTAVNPKTFELLLDLGFKFRVEAKPEEAVFAITVFEEDE